MAHRLVTPTDAKEGEYCIPLFCEIDVRRLSNTGADERFRIIYLRKGNAVIRIGNASVILIAPSLLCLSERERMTIREDKTVEASTVFFHPTVVNNAFSFETVRRSREDFYGSERQDLFLLRPFIEAAHMPLPIPLGPATERKMTELFLYLAQETTEPFRQYWPCNSRAYLIEILNIIQRVYSHTDMSEASLYSSEIERIILYIASHFMEKISITDIARLFCTNRTSLSKRFHEETGHTLIEYVHRLRIREACTLLCETDLPVSDVLYKTGFNDPPH
ncbi:MAG: helix-turn-helix domain-containing protein, partial [Spirochaetota bacterium]